jgi:aspartyl-tRNA(Asn)/glutamyl-tRNA(Gln) amidotransferase subunit A
MKPTYGLVSVRGAQALASSYDTVGPMARTVRDAALVLDAIAGFDAEDPWGREGASFAIADDGPRPRVGVATSMFFEGLDAEVAAAVEAAVAVAGGLAAALRDVTIPVDDDRTVFLAESYALHRAAVAETPEKLEPETLRRLGSGARVTASEYIEQRARLLRLRRDAAAVFADVDLIITPTTAAPAPRLADLAAEPERLRARELHFMRNTRPFNILGIPTISIPCGATRGGLPIGLQIAGAAGADDAVLRFAAALERALSAPPPTRIG